MKHLIILFVFIAGCMGSTSAQKQVRKDIRQGNKEYRKEQYTDAEVDYRRAIETNAHSMEAAYNLGNTLYRQGKGQESVEQYLVVTNNETDKIKLSKAWHNIGNLYMNGKDYRTSIEAYKKALRNNPKDDETRYNLALAQKLLHDQENQNQNQNQDKQDKQQQDQQQQQQNQDQKEQQQDQQQQQQNDDRMSKENADQILDAMMQEEKNTQEKVKAEQMQQQKQRKTDKNW